MYCVAYSSVHYFGRGIATWNALFTIHSIQHNCSENFIISILNYDIYHCHFMSSIGSVSSIIVSSLSSYLSLMMATWVAESCRSLLCIKLISLVGIMLMYCLYSMLFLYIHIHTINARIIYSLLRIFCNTGKFVNFTQCELRLQVIYSTWFQAPSSFSNIFTCFLVFF